MSTEEFRFSAVAEAWLRDALGPEVPFCTYCGSLASNGSIGARCLACGAPATAPRTITQDQEIMP